jgi:hypothetical protein
MPGGNRIEPTSFIMSAMMFLVLSAFLLQIPDQNLTFMTTKWGPIGPKQCAAGAAVLGLGSFAVWLLTKNRQGKK